MTARAMHIANGLGAAATEVKYDSLCMFPGELEHRMSSHVVPRGT